MFRDSLRTEINTALQSIGLTQVPFSIEHPTVIEHGDFSTNAAMVAARGAGKNPKALAEEIVVALKALNINGIKAITIAGPGFVNFSLEDNMFRNEVLKATREVEMYGVDNSLSGKNILVEHSSPNLFKSFHIGHLMNNAVGESIARLAKFSGAVGVEVISYPSDLSLGIAKAVAIMEDGGEAKYKGKPQAEQLKYFGECYAEGSRRFDEEAEFAERVKILSGKLYDGEKNAFYEDGKTANLEYFKSITEKLGSHFDAYIYESESAKVGEQIVRTHIGDVFKESDGAVIYEGEQDGLHTRVFINKEGRPTYESKDVGLLSLKFERYHPDLSVFVTDHEQAPYFEVVSTAAGKINSTWKEKTIHRTHGRMTFKGQKMSSRLGGVPLAIDIIDTLCDEVKARAPLLSEEDVSRVAIASIKFAILRAAAGKNINFDPETSLSFEGDSGPYLQYTVVRAHSVLAKASGEGYEPCEGEGCVFPEKEAAYIEKMLARFPEVVQLSISEWAPHHIATYLLETAQAFNGWYGNTKILDPENQAIRYNLAITKATAVVIAKGLLLLGIEVPSKM